MRRILLTGRNGQIGWELERSLAPLGSVTAIDVEDVDFTDTSALRRTVRELRPDIVVNAAGYTAVDRAEAEPDLVMAVNGTAPGVLAEEALRQEALLVHYSTDYVFDGEKDGPYTEQDRPAPLNVYGESKLAGERAIHGSGCAHLILRTSWVYGTRGRNFLKAILGLEPGREDIPVVDDQVGAPTWSRTVAEATAQILVQCHEPGDPARSGFRARSGIYHLTCSGSTSWYGFAMAILEEAAARLPAGRISLPGPARLNPVPTGGYPATAVRPVNSLLACDKLLEEFGITLPDWKEALLLCMEELYG
jgi:dTDP-4-dehydrorhamnose reductase